MNIKLITYIIGWVLIIEGIFIMPCAVVSLIYDESPAALLLTALICAAAGVLLVIRKPKNRTFTLKEGYISAALVWIIISLAGMLPFIFAGAIPNPVDAMFETVSGFTTTGASILKDVEAVPHGLIFWRSLTHWIGGMGILVFLIAVIPMVGGSKMNLMKAESPGPSISRILPTARESAGMLYKIYLAMTAVQVVLLLLGGMPVFDSLTITFGTAGTGGFGILNDSCASYSVYSQIIITIFMILFSINFNMYFFMIRKKFREAFSIEEVKWYIVIIAGAVAVIAFNCRHIFSSALTAVQQAAFQVASVISTTGYSSTDFGKWPVLSQAVIILLMLTGACSGSTGGGIKICRIVVMVKSLGRELLTYLYPGSVRQVRMDGRRTDPAVIRSIHVFFGAYAMIFTVSLLLITAADGLDFLTNFSSVASALGNIGPGLGLTGPASNFSVYSNFSTIVLTFDMLAGRLEIFPLLLFMPNTWKKF